MKYAIASLLASTSAIQIRQQSTATFNGSKAQCDANFMRMWNQSTQTLTGALVKNNTYGGKFYDPTFIADSSMLYNDLQTSAGQASGVANYKDQIEKKDGDSGVKYQRISDKVPGPLSLWGTEGINVKISEQGYDGDCWFLSQASSLAEYPDRIKAVFPGQDTYSDNGAFQVRIFVRGEPVFVVVDDIIPVYGYSGTPGNPFSPLNNSQSEAGAWWLVILEKAMAKANINYTGINGGHTGQAQRFLTGMPTIQYISKNLKPLELWNIVVEGLNNGYNMGAQCNVSHDNMVDGHAYGLLDAAQLSGGAHDGQYMVKTRNPWGNNKYNGPWSEDSADWTPEYRKQCGDYGTKNIGEIWLPLDVWNNYYADLTVNWFRDDWKITEVEGDSLQWSVTKTFGSDLNSWIEVNNPVEQDVILECHQNPARMFPDSCDSDNSPLDFKMDWMNTELVQLKIEGDNVADCNGDGLLIRKLPAGISQIRMSDADSWAVISSHNSLFKLRMNATKEPIKMTQSKGNNYIFKQ